MSKEEKEKPFEDRVREHLEWFEKLSPEEKRKRLENDELKDIAERMEMEAQQPTDDE